MFSVLWWVLHSRRTGFAGGIHQRYRRFVADGAVGTDLVVVPTPFLHLHPGMVKGQESMLVQAFGSELAVEGLDIGVVRGLPWPGQVQDDRQIEVAGDELCQCPPGSSGVSRAPGRPFKRLHDIFSAVAEARIRRWCVAREGILHRQYTDIRSRRQSIMHKVHGPHVVGPHGLLPIIPNLGLHPSFLGVLFLNCMPKSL